MPAANEAKEPAEMVVGKNGASLNVEPVPSLGELIRHDVGFVKGSELLWRDLRNDREIDDPLDFWDVA